MISKLSIFIPTYNRPEALRRTISCLLAQDLSNVHEIVILDNASDYDVQGLADTFNSEKIKVVKNSYNIGMGINIVMPMLINTSKWLWILSDDDELAADAISLIMEHIDSVCGKIGVIKFARDGIFNKPSLVRSLKDYIDYYYSENQIRQDDVVFISTYIFNMDLLKQYVSKAFEYSYSLLGFLVPMLIGLQDEKIQVRFTSASIVRYCLPTTGGWCHLSGAEKISTISHLPVSLHWRYRKKLLNILMPLSWKSSILNIVKKEDYISRQNVMNAYFGIYRKYLPAYERFLFFVLYQMAAISLGRKIIRTLIIFYRWAKYKKL